MMRTVSTVGTPGYRWKLAALSYISSMSTLLFNIQPVFVGVLKDTFGFDEQQLGILLASSFFSSCIVLGSSYFWVNRILWRHSISFGIAIGLLGLIICFFADDFATLMIGMSSASAGFSLTGAPIMLGLASMPNPTRAFSISICAMVSVAGICTLIIPTVLTPNWGYQGVIGFLVVLVGLSVLLLPMIPNRPPPNDEPLLAKHAKVNSGAWLPLIVMVIYFIGLTSNWAFLETLGNRAGIETIDVGVAVTLGLVLGLGGSVVAAIVHSRVSVWQAMVALLIGCVIYVITLVNAPGPIGFAFAVVLFCAVWNFSLPYTMDIVRAYDQTGRLLALVPLAQSLGGALGPLFAGPLLVSSGSGAVYSQLLACIMLATIAFSWLGHRSNFFPESDH